MTSLGSLAGSGGNWSFALDINDLGQIVGSSSIGGSFEPLHAFRYTGGVMTDLGTLGGRNSTAFSINNDGIAVGGADITNTVSTHGFFYNGAMLDIDPSGGLSTSGLRDINEGGLAVGSTDGIFLYSNGTISEIGSLGGNNAYGLSINNSGLIAGVFSTNSNGHALLYTGGQVQDLGTLGGAVSAAWSINDSGVVVGSADPAGVDTLNWTYNGEPGGHAFLWKNGVMLDLNNLIPNGSGWTLTIAHAINASGQIVGTGKNPNGQTHAFLLTPTLTCAGSPGIPNCHGQCVSSLAHDHRGLNNAVGALGYSSADALQTAIKTYCQE
jgi:probable HAF family extracellular repeat protein